MLRLGVSGKVGEMNTPADQYDLKKKCFGAGNMYKKIS